MLIKFIGNLEFILSIVRLDVDVNISYEEVLVKTLDQQVNKLTGGPFRKSAMEEPPKLLKHQYLATNYILSVNNDGLETKVQLCC